MKKLSVLALSLLAAAALSNPANAANGTLQFNGDLTNATCSITDGPGGPVMSDILVELGAVSFADLATATPGVGKVTGVVSNVTLFATCADADAYTGIAMQLDPRAGTGVDRHDDRLLALASGGASGAAIAVVDRTNTIINMADSPKITALLTATNPAGGRLAFVRFGATYLKTAGTEAPGVANASLPFVVTYE